MFIRSSSHFAKRHLNLHRLTAQLLMFTMLMLNIPVVPIAQAATVPLNQWVTLPVKPDPLMQGLNIPVDAATKGMWSTSKPWSLNSIHSILLADGRVLTFGTPFGNPGAQDGRSYDIWDPSLGFTDAAHIKSTTPDPVNSFCGTSGWLQDGRLMVAGGNGGGGKSSGFFTTTSNVTAVNPSTLTAERWYASMIGLADGRQLLLGGTVPYASPTTPTPEIFQNGGWRSLFGASSTPIFGSRAVGNQAEANPWYYPRAWLAPNGTVFGITSSFMFSLDPNANSGNGTITNLGTFKTVQDSSGTTTPNVGFTSSSVMYAPGKILQVGGNGITDNNPNRASQNATIIDINSGSPVISETNPMSFRRHWSYATVIPDGKVVVTGGTTIGWDPANRVGPAEIWNPNTGTWTVGASSAETRTYHSSAILLPNGTVFTGGGGAPGAVNNLNVEIYYPPNLFTNVNGSSQLAPRPVISAVSSLQGAYNDTLGVQMSNAQNIARLALIQTGSSTHSFNNTQRYIPINFTQAGNILTAQLPTNANLAPPGYYMLFALDANGVPSNSVMLGIGGVKAPPLSYVPINLPANAAVCASENNACTIPTGRTATVYFGANGSYNYLQGLTGNVNCSVAQFGDPIFGTVKNCYVVLDPLADIPNITSPIINAGVATNYNPTVNILNAQYSWNFGDGTPATPYSATANITHSFATGGIYQVYLTAKLADGRLINKNFMQAVSTPKTANSPNNSSPIVVEKRTNASNRIWVVNPDNDSVSVIDDTSKALVATINVGTSPRTLAVAPDGRIWVTNKGSATISIINPTTLAVAQTINLPRASQPHGIAFTPTGGSAFVVLEATGQLLKLDPNSGAQQAAVNLGNNPRHLSISADGTTLLVSRFITPALPGESTATIDTSTSGGEVFVVNAAAMTINKKVVLKHSDKIDNEIQGSGIPNYLGSPAISPDGTTAWVPSKQDNIKRGVARNGQNLNFQNTVRAISSRIDMTTLAEDYAKRIDHDNSSIGSSVVYHPSGAYMFVALETSREVAVLDAIKGTQLFRINVGRAPQGLAISADGKTLYVQEFMDRSVSVIDLSPLVTQGQLSTNLTKVVFTVNLSQEKLPANVMLGKQLFYDAKDARLARDSYMSCASCHNDGGHDGRVWDLTGFGEGLRNTVALKGRAGMSHGFLHWSANFDEIQDFEGQIRALAGGTGLMTDAQFNTGTRNQPLGDKKTGVSADLDNLAAYVGSLNTFAQSPNRNVDGSLTTAATAGKTVFANNCASCHVGNNLTNSKDATTLTNIGTINPLSGKRLNAALTGLDVPTLRDVWATAPYLHNGSAANIPAAIQAHTNLTLNATDLANVVAYMQQIGSEEIVQGADTDRDGIPDALDLYPNDATRGAGIWREQYNNIGNSDFVIGLTSAAKFPNTPDVVTRVNTFAGPDNIGDNYGSRIRGIFTAPETGAYTFWIAGDNETRLYLSTNNDATNKREIAFVPGWSFSNEWTKYSEQKSAVINLIAGQNYYIEVLHKEGWGGDGAAVAWQTPSNQTRTVITDQLFQRASTVTPPPPPPTANAAPTVNLTAPAINATYTQGTAITLSANAIDIDGTVTKVDFFDGATLIRTDATAPYSLNWTNAPTGIRSITARATDNLGAVTTSATVIVTVNAPAIQGVADGIYRLVAVHSGQVLDIQGISLADGALATQWPWTAGNNQRWQVTSSGNGQYTLTALHSGKLLEVAGCSLADGGRVQQWQTNGAPCQNWRIENLNDGSYRLVNVNSGKVLDVSEISQTAGAPVYQWTWVNGANQRWRLERQ